MRKVRIIARAELSNLFYSPIAWILLIIFLVQCSLAFTDAVHAYLAAQQWARLFPGPPQPATMTLMTKPMEGMFSQMVDKLYLYLPLLTMGLMSREISSGTIRLLYSSPVRTAQIVLGKFVAMLVYELLLILVLGLFALVAISFIPHADFGILWSALLGFFLLLGAYAAIGLFMSCLTSYQVVAALSTLVVFAALRYVGNIWQDIDFVRDITYFLSIGSRTENFFAGLITSRDLLYFIIIIVLFLCFSIFHLRTHQESASVWVKMGRYAGSLVVAIAIGYVSSRPSLIIYADASASKNNTITPATQALLRSTGHEPLEITAYVNLLDQHYIRCSPEARNTYLQFWEPYVRFKHDIRFKYVYYYDTTANTAATMSFNYKGKTLAQVAEEYAKNNHVSIGRFLKPEDARKIPGLAEENGRLVMQMQYKDRKTFLRVYDDYQVWPFEEHIAAALKRLLLEPNTVPRVGFLAGGLERRIFSDGGRNYSSLTTSKRLRNALVNNGFDLDTIGEGQGIPSGLAALVIADPKVAFSEGTIDRLDKYISGGGNLLLTGEPGKQDVLDPLLHRLGLEMRQGILVQQNKDEVPNLISPRLTETSAGMSADAARLYQLGAPIAMPGAGVLTKRTAGTDTGEVFRLRPLLALSGEKSWLKMGKLVNDSAAVTFDAAAGDLHGTFSPAISLTRSVEGKEQRIAVLADADFMANETIQLHSANPPFGIALFRWFSNGTFPVELSRISPKDLELTITDDDLERMKWVFVWIIPGVLIAAGSLLLIRRKRK